MVEVQNDTNCNVRNEVLVSPGGSTLWVQTPGVRLVLALAELRRWTGFRCLCPGIFQLPAGCQAIRFGVQAQ